MALPKLKNFKPWEFECKCGCGRSDMDTDNVLMIDKARDYAMVKFSLNSAYRCEKHNASREVGGSPTSSHLAGFAEDIKVRSNHHRFRIIGGLIMAGFTRILVYPKSKGNFIHADNDPNKPREILVLK